MRKYETHYIMKKFLLISALSFLSYGALLAQRPVKETLSENLKFSESTYSYDGGILVASFGTQELNPLNSEGKGYITLFKNGKHETFIQADGNLSAPKGMLVKDGKLYVCDVNKIVVYDIDNRKSAPAIIGMGEGHLFVNDLVSDGRYIYASVTNSGRIFRIDASNPDKLGSPEEWIGITGPNGLAIRDGKMYVASYPADGNTTEDNVLYVIEDLSSPVARKLTEVPGQYDGLAFSEDGKSLYFTNWTPAQVLVMDMETGNVSELSLDLDEPLAGPADITFEKGVLYIPDLPNSRVIVM